MRLTLTILTAPLRLLIGLIVWGAFAFVTSVTAGFHIVCNDYKKLEKVEFFAGHWHALKCVGRWTIGTGNLFE